MSNLRQRPTSGDNASGSAKTMPSAKAISLGDILFANTANLITHQTVFFAPLFDLAKVHPVYRHASPTAEKIYVSASSRSMFLEYLSFAPRTQKHISAVEHKQMYVTRPSPEQNAFITVFLDRDCVRDDTMALCKELGYKPQTFYPAAALRPLPALKMLSDYDLHFNSASCGLFRHLKSPVFQQPLTRDRSYAQSSRSEHTSTAQSTTTVATCAPARPQSAGASSISAFCTNANTRTQLSRDNFLQSTSRLVAGQRAQRPVSAEPSHMANRSNGEAPRVAAPTTNAFFPSNSTQRTVYSTLLHSNSNAIHTTNAHRGQTPVSAVSPAIPLSIDVEEHAENAISESAPRATNQNAALETASDNGSATMFIQSNNEILIENAHGDFSENRPPTPATRTNTHQNTIQTTIIDHLDEFSPISTQEIDETLYCNVQNVQNGQNRDTSGNTPIANRVKARRKPRAGLPDDNEDIVECNSLGNLIQESSKALDGARVRTGAPLPPPAVPPTRFDSPTDSDATYNSSRIESNFIQVEENSDEAVKPLADVKGLNQNAQWLPDFLIPCINGRMYNNLFKEYFAKYFPEINNAIVVAKVRNGNLETPLLTWADFYSVRAAFSKIDNNTQFECQQEAIWFQDKVPWFILHALASDPTIDFKKHVEPRIIEQLKMLANRIKKSVANATNAISKILDDGHYYMRAMSNIVNINNKLRILREHVANGTTPAMAIKTALSKSHLDEAEKNRIISETLKQEIVHHEKEVSELQESKNRCLRKHIADCVDKFLVALKDDEIPLHWHSLLTLHVFKSPIDRILCEILERQESLAKLQRMQLARRNEAKNRGLPEIDAQKKAIIDELNKNPDTLRTLMQETVDQRISEILQKNGMSASTKIGKNKSILKNTKNSDKQRRHSGDERTAPRNEHRSNARSRRPENRSRSRTPSYTPHTQNARSSRRDSTPTRSQTPSRSRSTSKERKNLKKSASSKNGQTQKRPNLGQSNSRSRSQSRSRSRTPQRSGASPNGRTPSRPNTGQRGTRRGNENRERSESQRRNASRTPPRRHFTPATRRNGNTISAPRSRSTSRPRDSLQASRRRTPTPNGGQRRDSSRNGSVHAKKKVSFAKR